ncbi:MULTISPECIES: stressosome-associated protein Prli42 [Priestia]|nr:MULTISPECIES: stressosome-associated protein Prli42 [Priestia]MCM3539517.1 stressosome-associated protein Prli42 [Priestia endophytica]MCY8232850.1 stressosome-associated protein Prli42 [Priestia endophytica]MDT3764315.1 stressosome-associated protein Prli42 [Priestia filamentosa]MED3725237.1 stressosome-associated protein Prli42 [Priestia filamentosa]MED4070467.1 stressosome-associated protein Prli42 [Priestia endophytica]
MSNKKIQKTIVMIMLGIMILSTIMIGISTWV